ncbi:MAG: ATP-binding cassette domain-containing protein, partial [Phycisphaerae bacterium]
MRGRKSKRIAKKAAGAPGTAVGPVAGQSAVPAAGDRVAWLTVIGARQNNLRGITVDVPLRRFVCVTGVSGSGKSSLVNDIILKALARDLNGAVKVDPGDHDRIDGLEHLDKVIDIDQSPIGRTPRSNPATYVKVFDEIRALYAKLPDSKVRGYKPGRFSFNVGTGRAGGGRCEACEGNGSNKMEMDFLADVWVTCPVCNGRRFSRETLQILYKGRSIADVLDLDVQEALEHFCNVPKIARMLRTLHEVGLDYIKLGQSSTTLSGGEAQRIKLARELVKKSTGATLYLLDEPTTGLHFADIKRLLSVLHGFVDAGNTVIVIEHNLDVIKTADWVIDLGPEGGAGGGRVVAAGTPEMVARSKRSYTGAALRGVLGTRRFGARANERNRAGKRSDGRSGTTKKRPRPRRDAVTVVGAKQHNLKDITVQVPRGKMTVCCGPSGSGKSSLAVDTIYTEGQRRYVESLSAYARQFLSRLRPPHVDHVYGLSPAVCIEQKTASKSPRSTVGTVTEIYDYLRVLWSRAGQPYCPACKIPIGTQTGDEIVERVLVLGEGRRILVLAQVHPAGAEHYDQLFKRERANGYARVRVDGTVYSLDQPIEIDRRRSHRIELVVDRIVVRKSRRSRLSDSVEQALALGGGAMTVLADFEEPEKRAIAPSTALGPSVSGGEEYRFSRHRSCGRCGQSYEELAPHHFSFNTRMGWCDACEGLGTQQGTTTSAVVHR